MYEKWLEVCGQIVLYNPLRLTFLQFDATHSAAWIKYAELETQLAGALIRARDAIDSGAGKAKLEAWVAATQI